MEATSSSSTSPCFFSRRKDSKCHHKAIEFACSACLFCVFCPLSIVWCCIKLPCKIGCKAAGKAKKRFPRCCHCGSEKKFYSSYSSFSDMDDSDNRPSKQEKKNSTSTEVAQPQNHKQTPCLTISRRR